MPRRPGAIGLAGLHVADGRVVDIAVIHGAAGELGRLVLVAKGLGQSGRAVVVVGLLQRPGELARMVANLVVGHVHRVLGELVRLGRVVIADAFQIGVGQHRDGRMADHATGIRIEDFPAIEVFAAAQVGQLDEGIDLVVDNLGGHDRQEGELAAKDVPAAEDRAVGERRRLMRPIVGADVAAIHVAGAAGIDLAMVQGREEGFLLGVGPSFDAEPFQGRGPEIPSLPANPLEVPIGNVVLQVGLGPGDAHERNARLHQHLLTVPRGELDVETERSCPHTPCGRASPDPCPRCRSSSAAY